MRGGRTCFGDVPEDRWKLNTFFSESSRSANQTYSRTFGSIGDIRSFAPELFGISPARARQMDPQQRLFLEVTRCALEDAGYARGNPSPEHTGVFLGISTCEHRDYVTARLRLMQMLAGDFGSTASRDMETLAQLVENVPPVQPSAILGQMLNMAAANVAQAFDFRGPAFAVDAACSSALVAVHEAMLHLRARKCDLAVAGGVYLNLTPDNFVGFSRVGALSRSGACRPLDESADGFVIGEGAGALVLRRLEDAIRDGDTVWAVIRGAGTSNDGASGGPLAPSHEGQVSALRAAYDDAGVSPSSVGFVEIHGTGTPIGDQIEVAALQEVMESSGVDCFLSSAKANIGHTLAAAGAASLIRATLALAFRWRPPQAALENLSDKIALHDSRFRVSTAGESWGAIDGQPRRAGVSGFGFGGTNAHLVLEEAPEARSRRVAVGSVAKKIPPKEQRFTVGAPNSALLSEYAGELLDAIRETAGVPLDDIVYTLRRRPAGAVNLRLRASTCEELLSHLAVAQAIAAGDEPEVSDIRVTTDLDGSSSQEEPDTSDARLCLLQPSPSNARPCWVLRDRAEPVHSPAKTEILNQVIAVVAEVAAVPSSGLQAEMRLAADLGFDSLVGAELLGALGKAFPDLGPIEDSFLADDPSLNEVAAFVSSHTSSNGAPASPEVGQSSAAVQGCFEALPEVMALRERMNAVAQQGLVDPYFRVHQGVVNDTTRIEGRDCVNFASYNYLGLAGDPDIKRAACEAVERYGTSVSASRLASGERPLHRELETSLANLLGCEDALVMVSGHATNVSALSHLLGPEDAVVHDALAHDSLLAGARQSGAQRRSFPHNDMAALDRILGQVRPRARRLLVAVEGIYSMDGDFAPLDQVTSIARRHQALVFVDEAHSLGTAGATGRGVGEHFGVDRRAVDIWMGTLSKSLASCGGYIAGSRTLIEYLKYTMPGFIYSVGISPANAAAALGAVTKLAAEPDRVARLQHNATLFLDLCRQRGIDTGLCQGTPVVPCIVGDSMDAVRLAQGLFERGINVQPIIHPAVEENQARLRFFVTADHTEKQLQSTADVLCEELARLRLAKPPAAEKRLARSRTAAN